MTANELWIDEMFRGKERDLFYERHQIGKNGNDKIDRKDAAHCGRICSSNFHVEITRMEAAVLKG